MNQIHTLHVHYKCQEIEICQMSTLCDNPFMVMLKTFDETFVLITAFSLMAIALCLMLWQMVVCDALFVALYVLKGNLEYYLACALWLFSCRFTFYSTQTMCFIWHGVYVLNQFFVSSSPDSHQAVEYGWSLKLYFFLLV